MNKQYMNWKIECEGFRSRISQVMAGDIAIWRLALDADQPTVPQGVKLTCTAPGNGAYSTWSPLRSTLRQIRPNWGGQASVSRIASGAPVFAVIEAAGVNQMTIALSDALTSAEVYAGIREETADFDVRIRLFTGLSSAMTHYAVDIRVDTRAIDYTDALRDVEMWWRGFYPPCRTPDAAQDAVYSTWYSYHQALSPEALLNECRLAAPMGMKTIIIDDGWQTGDNNRGYAYCGDWKLFPGKIPDMAQLVRDIHDLGVKVMIWYSVPYVGQFSSNYARFEGMYLSHRPEKKYSILDPRFPEVRRFLADTYATAVREWDLDGLKLDFIDNFYLAADSLRWDDRMDCISVEEGVQKLLAEIGEALTAINPDILIEFRQNYIGPAVRTLGNMLRVADCPYCAISNRVHSVDLRLLSGETAVHSDMLMWHPQDTVQDAARQMIATLYCVPQISMRLAELPEDHLRMVCFFLKVWGDHRATLLNGRLTALNPETGYSLIKAQRDGEAVITAWERADVRLDGCACGVIVNATGGNRLYLDADAPLVCRIHDCMGEQLAQLSLEPGVNCVSVPESGVVFFEKI